MVPEISEVYRVENTKLWKRYSSARQNIADLSRETSGVSTRSDIWLKNGSLMKAAGEVYLVHGCPNIALDNIKHYGFDIRYASRSAFGKGIYFADQLCKSTQYINEMNKGHLIISRVCLGTVAETDSSQECEDLRTEPCLVNYSTGKLQNCTCTPHHCSNSLYAKFKHNEYVIFEGAQCYPEYVIELKW
eukprot:TRINITY_DN4636_c0_g1_i2.p1 TRINITY_DN4636_c0_g1~~TRINITY_DN4636_c0_g1_i2.p1  ORF type:complete len:206 (+),score=10.07 TRINITY_DN4636_c0_g1_i2:52-618(+)